MAPICLVVLVVSRTIEEGQRPNCGRLITWIVQPRQLTRPERAIGIGVFQATQTFGSTIMLALTAAALRADSRAILRKRLSGHADADKVTIEYFKGSHVLRLILTDLE